jgi:putative ubiquitin-RnfH superfamily antitoxin RatB of RatAB toxin-antitoxin module
VNLSLPDGSALRDALAASGLLLKYGLDEASAVVGIWARKQPLDAPLRERDRVEIYRPLQCDPKEARRLRYKQRAGVSGNPKR